MALDVDDIVADIRFVKRKFGNVENHGQLSVEGEDVGYDDFLSMINDKKYEAEKGQDVVDDPPNEMFIEDAGNGPHNEMSFEDVAGDPQYELFLSSLKKDGSSYMLQVDDKNGLTMPIKYEEVESDDELEDNIQTKRKKPTNKEPEGQEALDSLSKTHWRALEIEKDLLPEPVDSIPSTEESYSHERERGNTCLSDNPRKHEMQGGSTKRLQVMKKSRKVADGKKVEIAESSNTDNDYALFRKNLRCEGSNVVFQFGNGLHVVYEGLDLQNFQTHNGKSSMKEKSKLQESSESMEGDSNCQIGSPRRNNRSKFRLGIMKILRKLYDKEEHKRLMHAITLQKSQSRHMDLRSGGVVFYDSNKKGKSYLDHHGDLKEKVKAAAKDDHKQLNLLRGFFFWIQNLTRDDSFIPWKDEECLAV